MSTQRRAARARTKPEGSWRSRSAAALLATTLLGHGAIAQTPPASQARPESQTQPGSPAERQNPVPGQTGVGLRGSAEVSDGDFFTGLWRRSNLLGDIGGLRTMLGNYGITLNLSETSEVFGNVTGGIHHGADYDGLTTMSVAVDTDRAFGLPGGTFNASAFQIHGRNLSAENLGTLQTASGIEATRSTRLWELWYQQVFLDGKADVKVGQQSLDQEFYVSAGSSLFINTMMGWPLIPSVDLYAGGPGLPALLARRAACGVQPINNLTVLAGVYRRQPAGRLLLR